MRALDTTLRGVKRARLIGHAVGLASYEGLALAGAAGDLAWFAGLQLAPALLLLELAFGAVNAPGRRLKRLAGELNTGDGLVARQYDALLALLDGLGVRAALRSLGVWLGAGLLLRAFFGLSWLGVALLGVFGALPAALAQMVLSEAIARKALAEGAEDREGAWPSSLAALKRWPSLRRRILWAFLSSLAVVLAPLGILEALGLPLSAPIVAVLAALGALSALAWGVDLDRSLGPPLGGLSEAMRRLSQGDFAVRLHPSGADALGEAAAELKESAGALGRRERALKAFGPGVDPMRAVALLPGLGAPAEARFVAVLAAGWRSADASLNALEPAVRLGALGRFYQSIQDAVQRSGGTVLEIGGGEVLAAWGAPGAPASSTSPASSGALASPSEADCLAGALKAAWMLRSSLAVAASQVRLRHSVPMDWSLAVASGMAAAGAWGPREEPRWALVGGPLAEVRRLGVRPGGPWLSEASASAAAAPYAVRSLSDAWELVGGPE